MKFPGVRLFTAAFAGLALAVAAQAQDIKIGYNGDLSASPSAQSGQAAVLGMQAAIDDINAAGGVLGKKLTLIVRDDTSAPPKSIQNMSDLIDNDKVAHVLDQLRRRGRVIADDQGQLLAQDTPGGID